MAACFNEVNYVKIVCVCVCVYHRSQVVRGIWYKLIKRKIYTFTYKKLWHICFNIFACKNVGVAFSLISFFFLKINFTLRVNLQSLVHCWNKRIDYTIHFVSYKDLHCRKIVRASFYISYVYKQTKPNWFDTFWYAFSIPISDGNSALCE